MAWSDAARRAALEMRRRRAAGQVWRLRPKRISTPADKAYWKLMHGKATRLLTSSKEGRSLYSVGISEAFKTKHFTGSWPYKRPPLSDRFELKSREDVTGVHGDKGYILIRKALRR